MKVVIFAAGQVRDYERIRLEIGTPDLVLCADGGLRHCLALGLRPALVLGDFDSAGPALMSEMEASGIPRQVVPTEKDQTDTHLALMEAVRRGATEILLLGATGDRLDHTLANLLLLPAVPPSVVVTLIDDKNRIRLIRPGGRAVVIGRPGEFLSLLPLSPEVRGVVAEGVKWPLDGATLRWGESIGISNQLLADEAFIATREGFLLVVQAKD